MHKKLFYLLGFISLIFICNIVTPSYLNGKLPLGDGQNLLSNVFSEQVLTSRQQGEFYRRPVIYSLQTELNNFGVQPQASFTLICLISFSCCFILCYYFIKFKNEKEPALLSLGVMFFLNFSILFAFHPIIMTYDEPVQYLFILVGLIVMFKYGLWPSFPFWLIATISREHSIVLLPAIFAPAIPSRILTKFIFCFLLILVYTLFIIWYVPTSVIDENIQFLLHQRMTGWKENFKDWTWVLNSLASFFLTLALPLIILAGIYFKSDQLKKKEDKIEFYLYCTVLILNTLMVFISGRARESRLFFPPLLLFLPIIIKYIDSEIGGFSQFLTVNKKKLVAFLILIVVLNYFGILETTSLSQKLYTSYFIWYISLIFLSSTYIFSYKLPLKVISTSE